jgi:2',3'-cyclic-nucleotide 2'-phosphodiesterase (5'-nucleotidase family)
MGSKEEFYNAVLLFADPFILEELNKWGKNISLVADEEIGRTKVLLDGDTKHCRVHECNLGNFIADAYVDYVSTVEMNLRSNSSQYLLIYCRLSQQWLNH